MSDPVISPQGRDFQRVWMGQWDGSVGKDLATKPDYPRSVPRDPHGGSQTSSSSPFISSAHMRRNFWGHCGVLGNIRLKPHMEQQPSSGALTVGSG